MRHKRFEDLPVWNTAIELAVAVFALTSQPQFKSQHSLRERDEFLKELQEIRKKGAAPRN